MKRASTEWTVGKLLTVVLVLVVIALVVIGLRQGFMQDLVGQLGERADNIMDWVSGGDGDGGGGGCEDVEIDGVGESSLCFTRDYCKVDTPIGSYALSDEGELLRYEGDDWEAVYNVCLDTFLTPHSIEEIKQIKNELRMYKNIKNQEMDGGDRAIFGQIMEKSRGLMEETFDEFKEDIAEDSIEINGNDYDVDVICEQYDDGSYKINEVVLYISYDNVFYGLIRRFKKNQYGIPRAYYEFVACENNCDEIDNWHSLAENEVQIKRAKKCEIKQFLLEECGDLGFEYG
ncbi:MAG: hypothetical protein ACP5D2_02170 [Candidatus Nanoarchaeia archaeon]